MKWLARKARQAERKTTEPAGENFLTPAEEPEPWETPISLNQPDLPAFDKGDFPPVLWAMIEAVAKATETPPELPAMSALAVIATTVQRKFEIEPEPGYREPLNLWTMAALPPASRKSAAQKLLLKPLQLWEIEAGKAVDEEIRNAAAQRSAQESRAKELQKKYAKADEEELRETLLIEMQTVEREMIEVPTRPQVFTQDITPEHLGTLMAANGEKMGIFSAEGGIFDTIAGRYSGGTANLDLFLQGHSGDMVRVDRGSRPPVHMQSPALSMGLCVQPDVLQSMASKPGFRGRGLIARFLYAIPPDLVGNRTLETMPIPDGIERTYSQAITALLGIPPVDAAKPPALRFDDEAHAEWKAFARWIESGMAGGGQFEHLRDFAGKLPGAAVRIIGCFHCLEHCYSDRPDFYPVSKATTVKGLSLAEKLSRHALHVFDLMGADGDIVAARKVLKWIRRAGEEQFDGRDCFESLRGSYPKREDLRPALEVLIERGYIRLAVPVKGPGRPKERYIVNPAALRRAK